jgi:hypothetical protein
MLENLECDRLNNFVQQLIGTKTAVTTASVTASTKGCDCGTHSNSNALIQIDGDCNCNNDHSANLDKKAIRYPCEVRKQQVKLLLEDLQTQMYSAASQDAYTFNEELKACSQDLELHRLTESDLVTRMRTYVTNKSLFF